MIFIANLRYSTQCHDVKKFLTASARAYQKHVLHGQETVSIFLVVTLQLYPVEEILRRYTKGCVNGPALVVKLQAQNSMTRDERIFFVKVLGKYLMKSALM